MKRQILISLILLSSVLTINAQWNDNQTFNIGSNGLFNGIHWKMYYNQSDKHIASIEATDPLTNYGGVIKFSTAPGNGQSGPFERMRISQSGFIGIGITDPISALHINGNQTIDIASNSLFNGIRWKTYYNQPDKYIASIEATDPLVDWGGIIKFSTAPGSGEYIPTERMRIIQNGFIGIGTACPKVELDVIGTIRAREVKVDLQGGCDFVFKSDYKLMDLKKLEEFVKTNEHLPEIAPEKEMVDNGVNMKELQMKLLQKMEEMTLYIIEQNKKIEQQNEKIIVLENELKEIKKK